MNILILCTYFRPDTAIAAKRPYMFAKHLSELGHSVTVIWSGRINSPVDNSFTEDDFNFEVISYSGKTNTPGKSITKKDFSFLPLKVFNMLVRFVRAIKRPFQVLSAFRIQKKDFEKIKYTIDHLDSSKFDVVFSTYGSLANIPAGKYAKEKFGCKWILDFRDRIVQPGQRGWLWNFAFSRYEKKVYNEADVVTTVSEDLFNGTKWSKQKSITIYNGYSRQADERAVKKTNVFSICYTGSLYSAQISALRLLFEELSTLIRDSQIDIDLIRFNFAGKDGDIVKKMAVNYGLQSIVNDFGYLQPASTYKLQKDSDLFLVLSWNMRKLQGVLSGKFYEGIQCEKPILSVIYGDTPKSELYRLNEKYHYGFCYETCRAEVHRIDFRKFILSLYKAKVKDGDIIFSIGKGLKEKFEYTNLTKELESVFYKIVEE